MNDDLSPSGPVSRDPRDHRKRTAVQQGLRSAYRTVLEEPVPDRLMSLLSQLDDRADGGGSQR